jgi:hypothetical protein
MVNQWVGGTKHTHWGNDEQYWLYTLPNVKVSHRVARLDEIRIGHTPYTAHPNLILESKFWILSH